MRKVWIILFLLGFLSFFQVNALQLIVHVNESLGTNVSGAEVFVYQTTNVGMNYTNTTNSTGFAVFNIVAGNYTINASKTSGSFYDNSTTWELLSDSVINVTLLNDQNTDPVVNILRPANNTNLSTSNVEFEFNYTDNFSATALCSLVINVTIDQNNVIANNNTNYTLNQTLDDGLYRWYIGCTDESGEVGWPGYYYFGLNAKNPSFTFNTVSPLYAKNNSVVTFNITASESLNQTPILTVDSNQATYSSKVGNEYIFTITINDSFSEGNITLNISGYDYFDTEGSNTSTMILDFTNPVINSANLSDNITTTGTLVNISVNASDTNGISSVYAGSTALSLNGGLWNGTINLTSGTVVIYVNDTAKNQETYSLNYTLDDSLPSLSITSPNNNYATNNTGITFNWTAYDSYSPTVSCSLYINSTLNTTVSGNGTFSTTVSNFNSGNYPYYVSCNDSANNTQTSSTRYFNIDDSHNPEITLSLSDDNTQNSTLVTLTASIISYSNVTRVNYSFANYSGNLSLNSGTALNGSWTATITLTDEDSSIAVTAIDYYNDSNSDSVSYTIDNTAPTTNVSSLSLTNTSTGSLVLSWSNDDANYLHKIYRKTTNFSSNATEGSLIATIDEGLTSYEDNTTIHGTMYYYAIMSVDQADNFNISIFNTINNTPTDKTKPRIPTSLNATRQSNNAMRLSWDAVTKDITGNAEAGTITYYIYRGTSLPVSVLGAATLSTTNTYVDDTYSDINGNISGNNYYYAIIAEDYAGNKNSTATTTTNATVGLSCSNSYSFGDYGACSNGIKVREGTRYCYGLDFDDDIQEIDDDNTCSADDSGDSGNDNPPSNENTTVTANLLATWNEISVDPYTYEIPRDDFSIKKIIWIPKASAQSGGIKLVAHSARPSKVSVLESIIFKFFEINHYGFELDTAEVEFFVTNTWLAVNDIDTDEVVLWHYDDGWIAEETGFINSDDEKSYFGANLTSFSVFAVGTKTVNQVALLSEEVVDEVPIIDNNNQNSNAKVNDEKVGEEVSEEVSEKSDFPTGFVIFLVTVILLGSLTVYFSYFNPILGKKIWLKTEEVYYKARKLKVPKKLQSDTQRIEELQQKMEQARKEKEAARIPETEAEAIKKYEKRDRILRF